MHINYKSLIAIFFVLVFGGSIILSLGLLPKIDSSKAVGHRYLEHIKELQSKIPNAVTAIYTNYRLYDTLLEILVFSTAILGVSFFIQKEGKKTSREGEIRESVVVKLLSSIFFPLVTLFGFSLALSAHLSPGGGFASGAIGGSAMLLASFTIGVDRLGERFYEDQMKKFEYTIIITIVIITCAEVLAKTILLPFGRVYFTITINFIIALKVFIGSWTILHFFVGHRGEI